MPHKADESFFNRKREWSRRKDLILEHYLAPYLAKVGTLGRPILVVDGFAGPGRFGDGEMGSPLIICEQIEKRLAGRHGANMGALCVEVDSGLHAKLVENLRAFDFAQTRNQSFLNTIDEIESLASTHSVILYLDPYAIQGIEWRALDRIFGFLRIGQSIEIILNFNAFAFVRVARSVCSLEVPSVEGDPVDATLAAQTSLELVDAVVGSNWWRGAIGGEGRSSASEVDAVIEGVCARLREQFAEVCRHDIKENWQDAVPKYSSLFASRHEDAVLLMNDAAAKSRLRWEQSTRPSDALLFETRPKDVVPDERELDEAILSASTDWIRRKAVTVRIARQHFGLWPAKSVNGSIKRLLKANRLESETGRAVTNDETLIRRWPG